MQTVLLVVQSLVALALIAVILIQRTAQDGGGLMGGGGGTMGGLFTARGSANLLTRTTAVLATIFILNSLLLGYIASSQHQTRSALDQIAPIAPIETPLLSKTTDSPDKQDKSEKVPQVPVAK